MVLNIQASTVKKKNIIKNIFLCCALLTAENATDENWKMGYVHFPDPFARLDTNNDGFISSSEAKAAGFSWSGKTGLSYYDLNSTYKMIQTFFIIYPKSLFSYRYKFNYSVRLKLKNKDFSLRSSPQVTRNYLGMSLVSC